MRDRGGGREGLPRRGSRGDFWRDKDETRVGEPNTERVGGVCGGTTKSKGLGKSQMET